MRITYVTSGAWLGEDGALYQQRAGGTFEPWRTSRLTTAKATRLANHLGELRRG